MKIHLKKTCDAYNTTVTDSFSLRLHSAPVSSVLKKLIWSSTSYQISWPKILGSVWLNSQTLALCFINSLNKVLIHASDWIHVHGYRFYPVFNYNVLLLII